MPATAVTRRRVGRRVRPAEAAELEGRRRAVQFRVVLSVLRRRVHIHAAERHGRRARTRRRVRRRVRALEYDGPRFHRRPLPLS